MLEELIGRKVTIVLSSPTGDDATTGTVVEIEKESNQLKLITSRGLTRFFTIGSWSKLKVAEE